jgi:uncharacterized protein YggT (Ycf19 family)
MPSPVFNMGDLSFLLVVVVLLVAAFSGQRLEGK